MNKLKNLDWFLVLVIGLGMAFVTPLLILFWVMTFQIVMGGCL